MSRSHPIVGLVADLRVLGQHPFHCVGNKYIQAVAVGARAVPIMLPALAESTDFDAILGLVDGLLFTGSPSNVDPDQYDTPLAAAYLADTLDPARDATTLPLIRAAIDRAIPVLGLCRGFQEINVACGGSLHQEVHRVAGLSDHREDETQPLGIQYGPSHDVSFTPDGMLRRLTGVAAATVNSLHGQGIDRLAPGLVVEALAPDGLVEAFTLAAAPGFNLALQWHPEWMFEVNPVSQAIFTAFGDACRAYQALRPEFTLSAAPAQSVFAPTKILENS